LREKQIILYRRYEKHKQLDQLYWTKGDYIEK